jgi:uncharacterized protein YtpQ (UPF0354 family)
MSEKRVSEVAVKIEPSTVLPRIKPESWLVAVRGHCASAAEVPFTRPLAGDLVVAYAVDDGAVFRMINAGEVAGLGVTGERVHEVSVENVRRRVNLEVGGRPPVLVLECGGDLEACLLLIDGVWPQLAVHLPGEVVVGVPTRSVVFVTGSGSPEGLQVVREGVVEFQGRDEANGLSKRLFVRRGTRWEVFE